MEKWRRIKHFWADADQQGPDECWLWYGTVDTRGYGRTGRGDKQHALAHRVAYEFAIGPIPPGHHVHHTCGVARCCNPLHLEAIRPEAHAKHHSTRRPHRTHCRRGHPFEGDNVIVRPDGMRLCRACQEMREARRAGTAERKAQAAAAARQRRADPEYAEKMRAYQREWAAKKRASDPEFLERERAAAREYQRRKREAV